MDLDRETGLVGFHGEAQPYYENQLSLFCCFQLKFVVNIEYLHLDSKLLDDLYMFFDRLNEENTMAKSILQFEEIHKTILAYLENKLILFLVDNFPRVALSSSELQIERPIYVFLLSRPKIHNGGVHYVF